MKTCTALTTYLYLVMESVTLVLLPSLLASCLAAPAKLNSLQGRIDNQLAGYNYEAPAVPSGLYELPGPPVPPVIPPRRSTTTSTTTTTTTTTPPPPPPGLYGPPEFDRGFGPSNLHPNFISLPVPVEPPKLEVRITPTPAIARTPRGFTNSPTPMPPKDMNMPYMPYDISWGVEDEESGNVFSHSETSGGNDVQGEYRVLLPDGRMQVVTFNANPESGYNANVRYL